MLKAFWEEQESLKASGWLGEGRRLMGMKSEWEQMMPWLGIVSLDVVRYRQILDMLDSRAGKISWKPGYSMWLKERSQGWFKRFRLRDWKWGWVIYWDGRDLGSKRKKSSLFFGFFFFCIFGKEYFQKLDLEMLNCENPIIYPDGNVQ